MTLDKTENNTEEMKLKFKIQDYQTKAVQAVIDCFKGQPNLTGIKYKIDPGALINKQQLNFDTNPHGFRNHDLTLTEAQVLENIRKVQRSQNLPESETIDNFKTLKKDKFVFDKAYQKVALEASRYHLDIEMETGTGKTYCYIKTMFEMYKQFGWNKFIIVVPSIAIREGVFKSFQITAEHFQETYHKKAKFFIYNSKRLHELESFSSDSGINVMIINVQAFNAKGKDQRRIYEELDDFQSRRPIDVIKANRPILIVDEPQKMEGKTTLESFKEFNALMILRYSATHKSAHNKIHRLDALDAYNQKLVKKIAIRGITVKGLTGTNAYLYLQSIETSKSTPVARIEFEIKQGNGIKRQTKRLQKGDNLFDLSNNLDQYKDFVISDINANTDKVTFLNGKELFAGQATGDINESVIRRIQIRETIKAHLEKEQVLFNQDIKVLSLFFIDSVAKYRSYNDEGQQAGEYAKIFEEEYINCINEIPLIDNLNYKKYLDGIEVANTHNGYFSIDKKTKHLVDPSMNKTEKKNDETNDVDAYNLILKDKEKLLSFKEPIRFIFSHSALREGWDNPNIFVICTLKHSENTISRRQEVGRGLRVAVNQRGERQDNPASVHNINVLTVVPSESYKEFATNLQKETSDSLSERPRIADANYFKNKLLKTETGEIKVTEELAKGIEFYLIQNGYVDRNKQILDKYHEAKNNNELAELPEDLKAYSEQILTLVDSVYSEAQLPELIDDRINKTNPLNDNFNKKEFKELWNRINKKAVYSVKFDSQELINKCIPTLDLELKVTPLTYTIQRAEQNIEVTYDQIKSSDMFMVKETNTQYEAKSVLSSVKYDLIGKIAEATKLRRITITNILQGIKEKTFYQFKTNPENFISEASRLINEQKASVIIERLSYDMLNETHNIDIFTEAQNNQNFSKVGEKLKRHVFDYVVTDSKIEKDFVTELDTSTEVVVYAKLPNGFTIPTPVGNYNPDWAIAFKEGAIKHIYFVAETKGTMSSLELREIEKTKIKCARKFFDKVNLQIESDEVRYDVVDSYGKLMEVVN